MGAVADLPVAAVGDRVAAVLLRRALVGLGAAEVPVAALVVCQAVSLAGDALLGGIVAPGVVRTVLVVVAEADFRLAEVRLEVALLEVLAVAVKVAPAIDEVA